MYTDTHTYKQKVLLYSKFMFNGSSPVHLRLTEITVLCRGSQVPSASCTRGLRGFKVLPHVAVAVRSRLTVKHKFTV